jgi:hypothetical protein
MRLRVPEITDQTNAMEVGDPNIPPLSPVKQMEDKESHHISYKVCSLTLIFPNGFCLTLDLSFAVGGKGSFEEGFV